MEVSGQLHVPAALSPGKEPLLALGEETGWAPEPICEEKNFEPQIIHSVAQRYTTELSRVLYIYMCVYVCRLIFLK
jgi:hypothetical protein